MMQPVGTSRSILVVGAGIGGITAALEAAETGKVVILIEKRPFIGGRITQLYKYFPKLCHPTCGLEINQRRIKANPRLKILTQAEVEQVTGTSGAYTVTVRLAPRYVNERCTACGDYADAVEARFADDLDYRMGERKGAYLPYAMAYPPRYVIDPRIIATHDAERAKDACRYDAIDLEMREERIDIQAGAIIWATGWRPYDAARIHPYGYSDNPNVVTSVELERMMDPRGPTGGRLVHPSDGKEINSVAFVQCAGRRSMQPGHLPYCSGSCCAASIKQALYFKDANPRAETTVLYTDLRVPGARGEDFYRSAQDRGVTFSKGVVREVSTGNDGLEVKLQDKLLDQESVLRPELVVLATGLVPNAGIDPDAAAVSNDDGDAPKGVEVGFESVLNLNYCQGTDLPQLVHGFADSHFICFPYETRLCARHPGALPGLGQHDLDHRCAQRGLRRRDADGLPQG